MLRFRTTTHMTVFKTLDRTLKKEQNHQNAGHYSARPYVKILAFQNAEIKRRSVLTILPVCDKRRLQTCRLADSQTHRPADLQTGLYQLILKTISCNLRRFPVTHLLLRSFKPWTGRAYFPTCF